MKDNIDFVVLWVDGNDPKWQTLKNKYEANTAGDTRITRFRDWDNLQFWFRGAEKYAPWVNKIHFVTWGHYPQWLNINHPKINFVRHEDYIPEQYLPTFSSRTIELNLHRIESLSNRFVLFNDDMFTLKRLKEEDMFRKGLPCDSAILKPLISSFRNSIGGIVSNNMEIINTTFNKNKVIRKNVFKWFNPIYKRNLISTICLMPYKNFVGFINSHLPISYLKDTFFEVWEAEFEALHNTCCRKFRDRRDVNHWLFRYWQISTGKFVPRSVSIGRYLSLTNNNKSVEKAIIEQKYKLVCLNDDNRDPIIDFEKEKDLIKRAFEKILPEKSSFEL